MVKMLDVLVSMALTYFIFAVLCSALIEGISAWVSQRSAMLRSGILRMLGGKDELSLLSHPWISGTGQTDKDLPSYLRAPRFADALLQRLQDKLAEGERLAVSYAAIRKLVLGMPESPTRTALAPLFLDVDSTLDQLRTRTEDWFNQQMDRVSGWYKRWVQGRMLIAGLLFAALFNIDSIQMFKAYWKNAALREQATSMALRITGTEDTKKHEANLRELATAGLPIGWDRESLRAVWAVEPIAATQGKPGQDGGWLGLVALVLKVLGFLLTAAALVPGAQFWFEMLSQLLNIRSAGQKPDERKPAAPNPGKGDAPGTAAGTAT